MLMIFTIYLSISLLTAIFSLHTTTNCKEIFLLKYKLLSIKLKFEYDNS